MGIRGLFTLIDTNTSSYQIVDLVRAAKEQNEIEILVDFHAFVRELIDFISKKVVEDNDNEYLSYQMAEYEIFIEAACEFHQHFQDAGIKLVWIIDGPKGLDEEAGRQKMETWIKRDKDDIAFLNDLLASSKYKKTPEKAFNLGPFLSFESLVIGLKKANAEVIQLLQGGSDEFIAYTFEKRKSFAVITNDTDFLIFPNLKVIFPRMMGLKYGNNNSRLPFMDQENPGKIFKRPESFYCPIVSQRDILKIFDFREQGQLIALSVIKGNDNTEEYAQMLQFFLKIAKNLGRNAHVTQVAKYIVRNKVTKDNILQLPGMIEFMKTYPQISEAINFCYKFYTLENFKDNLNKSLIVYDPTINDGSLTHFFREKYSMSKISKESFAIHRGIYHEPIFFERPSRTCLSNAEVLSEIRSKIYPYVLDESLNEVTEWQSRHSLQQTKIPVEHSVFKTPEIKGKRNEEQESANGDSIIYGIDIFEEIWSHLEENPLRYVKTFDLHRGFLCYMLRYFYKNTINKNLNLKNEEFQALFITVFYQYEMSQNKTIKTRLSRSSFLGMKICPTETCLIMFSWFMGIYYAGKYLCGGAFNLTDDFPSPDQVMSASVWFAFYEHAVADQNHRTSDLDDSIILSLEKLEKDIMDKYNSEFEAVTK